MNIYVPNNTEVYLMADALFFTLELGLTINWLKIQTQKDIEG